MSIKMGKLYHPFSHLPGESFTIPFSSEKIEIFPTAFRLLSKGELIHLPILGPVKGFTALVDFTRGLIKVFGTGANGYFQYSIYHENNKIVFSLEKGAIKEWPYLFTSKREKPKPIHLERLSFGIQKSPDWELVKRRSLIEEILPFWFLAGQTTVLSDLFEGGHCLLTDLANAIEKKEILKIGDLFLSIFKAGFKGVFSPLSEDHFYQGYSKNPLVTGVNPDFLLQEGYRLIRKLLLKEDKQVEIAPLILSLFSSGRAIGLKSQFGFIDFEWTKRFLRRFIIKSENASKIFIQFPKEHRRCRLKENGKVKLIDLTKPFSIQLKPSTSYFFDRFEA